MASDPERPLVSIVTAVFNGARTLPEMLASLRAQRFRDFELIVMDGGSSDGTQAILAASGDIVDFWASERDTGIYHAWNKALDVARGRWIGFLGADDVYLPDALERYASAIVAHERDDLDYISSRVQLVKNGEIVRTIGVRWSWPAFAHHMTVAHVGSLHHRSLFERHGRFDQSYRACADYEFLLRPGASLRASYIDRVTARMALGGASNANLRLALLEQERAKRTTGGRAAWRCGLERRLAYFKDRGRSLLWY